MRTEERIGPYRVLEEIGVGGMGEVSLARDAEGRAVAVKVLHPAIARDEICRRRMEREVSTMRRVRSPYIAEVVDADFSGRRPYIVTRYVQGRTLEEVVRDNGPLRGAALTRVVTGLARALAAVHTAGVVHRDVKPANVVLADGDPVVIDFGLAHVLDATRLTLTGTAIGTPGYLAPEILDGERAEPAADVFSWAATVVFAATGRSPYGSGPPEAVFSRVLRGRHDLSGLPRSLVPHVQAGLALSPERRPSSPELLERLARSATSLVTPPAPPSSPRVSASPERAAPAAPRRGAHPLRAPALAVLPALSQVAPTLAAALALVGFLSLYVRDAGKRMRNRITAADGTWFGRVRARLAALVALPLELSLRTAILSAAGALAYLAIFLPLHALWPDPRAVTLPFGALAVLPVLLRGRRGRRGRHAMWLALAAVLLASAVLAAPAPLWWPLPTISGP
ncbi:serine/threonine protein kinase [Actinomadura barringtoniae]|uniref:Serine/threonine protein kinase n=1 Tax=Actinomadura barringtoniae TaxID=1427535 RepID=A0A939T336_9ACTN|nr:serine/threonine-protein kinase [Actinomadura barringtoniae]MBO2450561.1 serine/threonine protein kinase [Actinomadura barringtoniae]